MDARKLKTKENYDGIANLYINDFGKDYEYFETFIIEFVNILKRQKSIGPIIDLGSGPGNVVDYLLQHGVKNLIFAVDFSINLIHYLKEKYQFYTQVTVVNDDFVEYIKTIPKKTVSGVTANYSIIHVTDKEIDELFENIYSILEKGGLFVCSVFEGKNKGMEPEPYQVQKDQRIQQIELYQSYVNNFSRDELTDRLTKAGFIIKTMHIYNTPIIPGEYSKSKIWTLVQK